MSPVSFTVAVCDDEPDFRARLTELIDDDPRFEVAFAAGTLVELSRGLAGQDVDAVILDYGLPGVEGADAVKLVTARTGKPVFVMSSGLRHHVERRALAAGATAFFPKQGAVQQLIETVHHHLSGCHASTIAI